MVLDMTMAIPLCVLKVPDLNISDTLVCVICTGSNLAKKANEPAEVSICTGCNH